MLSLSWTDWLGLCFLAFGLVAGLRRGMTHQFIRLLILLGALAGAGALAAVLGFHGGAPDGEATSTGVWAQLGLFGLLWLILLYLHRIWILPRYASSSEEGGDGPGVPLRIVGGAAGLVGALILHGVLVSAVFWTQPRQQVESARGAQLARQVVSFLGYCPSPPRPEFIDLTLLSPAPLPDEDDSE